ncbi:MAG TPA: hypothetical protein VE377_05960 [Candidatus Dormibacteraeota bacterium]|nr:hypothetical protein [Candidatus Dormibacteraeota bacterium]
MSKVSAWRKVGIVGRVVRDQAGRSRTLSAVVSAVSTTARSFGNALHQLWLEVTGLIFLVMALGFVGASIKEYGRFHARQVGGGRFALAVFFAVTFAWFGLSSFWRVRRKSQRP